MALHDNLILLRNLHGLSQEEVSEKVDISRQAYARWEKGDTIPDVEKCAVLAELYGTTIDTLFHYESTKDGVKVLPAPKGKHIYGTVTMSERGQIVIPKQARDSFHMKAGERLVVLGDDEQGLALIQANRMEELMKETLAQVNRSLTE